MTDGSSGNPVGRHHRCFHRIALVDASICRSDDSADIAVSLHFHVLYRIVEDIMTVGISYQAACIIACSRDCRIHYRIITHLSISTVGEIRYNSTGIIALGLDRTAFHQIVHDIT